MFTNPEALRTRPSGYLWRLHHMGMILWFHDNHCSPAPLPSQEVEGGPESSHPIIKWLVPLAGNQPPPQSQSLSLTQQTKDTPSPSTLRNSKGFKELCCRNGVRSHLCYKSQHRKFITQCWTVIQHGYLNDRFIFMLITEKELLKEQMFKIHQMKWLSENQNLLLKFFPFTEQFLQLWT